MSIRLQDVSGTAVEPYIEDLARLRITVFREFPYLYDGDPEYERGYLRTYSESPRSLFVLAIDEATDTVVGASTGVPMVDETDEFRQPFVTAGFNPEGIFYFGESVLLPEYRGQGIGVRFFEHREAFAASLAGITLCTFCAVDRPADHPRRPPDYQPLDAFWQKRGFTRRADIITTYSWKDLDETDESPKPMTFWIKSLADPAREL